MIAFFIVCNMGPIGSWKLEVGSWKLEVGSWKLEDKLTWWLVALPLQ
ncbi:MAG: hypothetical protein HRU04_22295 [Oceanospirillaceae bacterium]|nr:hypothetical protein [Oceanospirillaceae bacterium]